MEKSFWADDNPIQPVNAARQAANNSSRSSSQHTRPDTNLYQSTSIFQRPQTQPIRMASADPSPGPTLHNPAVAAQMGGLNRSMTQATSRNAPRSRATHTPSNRSSQPPARPDSAVDLEPALFANTTNTYASHQPAPPRNSQALPTITVDDLASTPTSTSTSTMPSRAVPPHPLKDENKRTTLRDPSPDGEQWRTQKDNKFTPFLDHVNTYDRKGRPYTTENKNVLLEHAGTRNSSRFGDNVNECTDLDASRDFKPTLSYDDYAEPKTPAASAAPVRTTTATSSSNAIEAALAEILKANEKREKKEQDAKFAREIEDLQEREAREEAARVAAEQEEVERAAEPNRQRHDVQTHEEQATAVAAFTASQSDTAARLAAALDRLFERKAAQAKTEALLELGQEKLVKDKEAVEMELEQVRLLRRQQVLEAQLDSAE